MDSKTNWLALITSVVLNMVLGFLWYGMFFSKPWMAGNGITLEGEKMFKNGAEIPMTPTPMVVNVVSMFVYALLFNWLLKRLNVNTWQGGATFGASIGLIMLLGVITGNLFAVNPFSLSMVDGSFSFVTFTLMGAIIGGWQKK